MDVARKNITSILTRFRDILKECYSKNLGTLKIHSGYTDITYFIERAENQPLAFLTSFHRQDVRKRQSVFVCSL